MSSRPPARARRTEIFLNSGTATFTALTVGAANEDSRAVAAGDINGDRLTDLVFANGSPSTVYTNQGSAGVFAQTGALGNADSRGVVLVDLFGDALPELVLANARRRRVRLPQHRRRVCARAHSCHGPDDLGRRGGLQQ